MIFEVFINLESFIYIELFIFPKIHKLSFATALCKLALPYNIMVDQLGKYQFGIALIFRLVDAFTSTTFFQPDEYFQSWEVAFNDVYGVGFRSWEWDAGLRTSLIPRLFAGILRLSSILHLNHITVGKIFMAHVAALADLYTASLSELIFPGTGKSAFLLSLFSMFNWYVSTRPFSNTFEMTLVTVSMYWWLKATANIRDIKWKRLIVVISLAQVAIALRPNEAILWIFLGVDVLLRIPDVRGRFKFLTVSLIIAALSQVTIGTIDWSYFRYTGKNIFPVVEFIKYNLGFRISDLYGVQPWHWYFTQGVPFLLLGYVPFFIAGLTRASIKWKLLLLVNLIAFSIVPHKEFRFLYFLIPLLHSISALGLPKIPKWLRQASCLLNIVIGIYFNHFHQRGVMDVVNYIGKNENIKDVTFLMPCHSTPWQAHFQRQNDPLFNPQFLTCNPPWNITNKIGYIDEAHAFYMDPTRYLARNDFYITDYVAVFEPLLNFMKSYDYSVVKSFNNGLFNEDSRRTGRVYLLKKNEIKPINVGI